MHLMLDLETFGTKPGSIISSIGACVFDPFGSGSGKTFYANIDIGSCLLAGLTIDPNTALWWSKQTKEAQDSLLINPQPLATVAQLFRDFWFENKCVEVWAQGSNFDPGLWEEASARVGIRAPWQFYNTRDTRTVYKTFKFDAKSVTRNGTYHNALDDAIHQVKCVQMAINKNG